MALRPMKYLDPLSFEASKREALKDIKVRAEYTRLGPEFARYKKKIRAKRQKARALRKAPWPAWKADAAFHQPPLSRNTPRPWDAN